MWWNFHLWGLHVKIGDHPFTRYVLADSLRVVCIAMGVVTIVLTVTNLIRFAAYRRRIWGRLYAFILAGAIVVTGSELGRMGHQLTWRLLVSEWMLYLGVSVAGGLKRPAPDPRDIAMISATILATPPLDVPGLPLGESPTTLDPISAKPKRFNRRSGDATERPGTP